MGNCLSGQLCCASSSPRDEEEPLVIQENERQAIEILIRTLDHPNEVEPFSGESLDALSTLVYSSKVDLQQSAALAFADITETYVYPVHAKVIEPIFVLLRCQDVEIQRAASAALGNLAVNVENKRLIVEMGGLGVLIKLMMSPNVEVQCNATGCMTNLANYEDNKAKIARSGALLPLLKLAKSKDGRVQRNSTGALLNMTHSVENRKELVYSDAIPVFVSLLASTDLDVQFYCITSITNIAVEAENRQLLANTEPHLVHHFVHLMGSPSPQIQCQAALALRNLACDFNYQVEVVRANGLPLLLNLLKSTHADTCFAAVACLRNVSMHSLNEAAIVDAGFLEPLVNLITANTADDILCLTISILRNLAASSEKTKVTIFEMGVVQMAISLLSNSSSAVQKGMQVDVTAFIAVMALGDELKSAMIEMGVVELLVPFTMAEYFDVQGNAAAALGNLASKVENYDPFVNCWSEPDGGIQEFLLEFFSSKEPSFEFMAVWMTLQLLESGDSRLVDLISQTPKIESCIDTLASQGIDELETDSNLLAIPALSRRIKLLLK